MAELLDVYRAVHEQGFLPIFCENGFDSRREVEACAQAGLKAIEYTLRSADAREMIPWVRCEFPDLYVLVGSTVDDEGIVRQMQRRHPQLMTLGEVADLDVHGFVSMLGWTEESIRRWSPTHLVMPTAMTVREALLQTSWGAQFQKLAGSDLGFVKRCRGAAAFDYCPILVTGGMTPERIPEAYEAGAAVVGAGFDLILKGRSPDTSAGEMARLIGESVKAAQQARAAAYPDLAAAADAPAGEWLAALPHWHPFGTA